MPFWVWRRVAQKTTLKRPIERSAALNSIIYAV
jgi:hypothetical protein